MLLNCPLVGCHMKSRSGFHGFRVLRYEIPVDPDLWYCSSPGSRSGFVGKRIPECSGILIHGCHNSQDAPRFARLGMYNEVSQMSRSEPHVVFYPSQLPILTAVKNDLLTVVGDVHHW